MNLPTQHQVVVAGAHIATAIAAIIATLGFTHIFSSGQVADASNAVSQIGDGLNKIMTGLGTLVALGSGIYATIQSGPFASLFRAATAIASDPVKLAQIQQNNSGATLEQKASIVLVTDKMPEVAGVGTVQTVAGKALAEAVPSSTVQPVASIQSIAKAV